MASNPNKTDVFQFMSVRSPQSVEPKILRYFYIQDVEFAKDGLNLVRKTRDVFAENSSSAIGTMLFKEIFYEAFPPKPTPPPIPTTVVGKNNEIIKQVLLKLDSIDVESADDTPATPATNERKIRLESFANNIGQSSYITIDPPGYGVTKTTYYLIPDQLDNCFDLKKEPRYAKVIQIINDLRRLLEIHTKNFDKNGLINAIKALNGNATKPLYLFNFGIQDTPESILFDITIIRAKLFDALYTLYILRRIASIDLEHIIKALQTLHVLEWLVFDEFLTLANNNQLPQSDNLVTEITKLLQDSIDELKDATFTPGTITFSFIKTKEDLIKYFEAAPIIHPVVAKLHWFRHPFNEIKPVGIGDLKVVKQWLCGYKAGEISHIHNIMKSEIKERTHRHLEKSEDVFSFSSEQSENTQLESQSTDRFEMKREAEKAIKTDLNIGANANFTYNNPAYGITTSVGATFAYANSNQDTQRSSSNYAREIMDKAVSQVQSKATQNRSSTKIFETEETNKHGFDNTKAGATHISGIYRWLDKRYKAQLYNYGKRLMFEFIIPEPAAFYVESKLKAVEFEIDIPQKPVVEYEKIKIWHPTIDNHELEINEINKDTYQRLRKLYDLDEAFPSTKKNVSFINPSNSVSSFEAENLIDDGWVHNLYECALDVDRFYLDKLIVVGSLNFQGKKGDIGDESSDPPKSKCINTLTISVNGTTAFYRENNENIIWALTSNDAHPPLDKPMIIGNSVSLIISIRDGKDYKLKIYGEFIMSDEKLFDWQSTVYNKIKSIEKSKIDKKNQELELAFNSQMTEYHNKLNELNAQAINDLIQGRSEAFNRQIIREELKKHCLAMIAKEFDSDNSDDIISKESAITDEPPVEIIYDKFEAGEKLEGATGKEELTPFAEFKSLTKQVNYHKINIDVAKKQAKFVQFLEQAFEWQQIAYVFYPYFWANEKKWITLMNRLDYTDNNMTAFLKAGSVRVLIAATPGYNDAVMHFLSTREPWEGGSLPVIGDPLFIPVYEEIRKQQDDLQNATPEGEAWEFEVPTSLIYLHDSSSPLPTDLKCDEDKETGETDDNTQETPNIFSCLGQLATCLCFHLRKGVISGYKQIFPE